VGIAEILQAKRSALVEAGRAFGVVKIRVFGSVAKGTANEQSDVDLLVEVEPGRSLFDLGGFVMAARGLTGRNVDVVTEEGLKARMRDKVLKEAVPL
jgi:predicted nucleotidyltransferase